MRCVVFAVLVLLPLGARQKGGQRKSPAQGTSRQKQKATATGQNRKPNGQQPQVNKNASSGNKKCQGSVKTDQHSPFDKKLIAAANKMRAEGTKCPNGKKYPGGAKPLKRDPSLGVAAMKHAKELHKNQFFASKSVNRTKHKGAHTGVDGSSPTERAKREGWQGGVGEVTAGLVIHPKPQGVVDRLLKSDGHCSIIMNPKATHVGAGSIPGTPRKNGKPGKVGHSVMKISECNP